MKGTVLSIICCITCAVTIPSEVISMANNPDQTVMIGGQHKSSMGNVKDAMETIEQAFQSLEALKTASQTFASDPDVKADEMLTVITAQAFEFVNSKLTDSRKALTDIYNALEKYRSISVDQINKCEQSAKDLAAAFEKLDEALGRYQSLAKSFELANKFTSTVLEARAKLLNKIENAFSNINIDFSYVWTLLPNTAKSGVQVIDKTSENIKLNQKGKRKWGLFNKKAQ